MDTDQNELALDAAVQAIAPEGAVVTNYVVVFEYVSAEEAAETRHIDLIQSMGMTPWLRSGMMRYMDEDDEEEE
jgi:hypothetical protein